MTTTRNPTSRSPRRLMCAAVITAAASAMSPWDGAFAQDKLAPTPPPATAPAPAANVETLIAKITALKGVVQVRTAENQPWKPATVGMEVDEGAEFRTGPRSAVQFVIPPDQTITLDRLGTIKVLQAIKDSGKVTTALGMKYGRTRYDIQAADLEHDSTIRSPGSTLAIRGTDVTFEDSAPFAPSAVSRHGRAQFKTNKRQFVSFGGKQRANVSAERTSPAETALVRTRTDPQSAFSGRSEAEQNLVVQLPSLGGPDKGGGAPGFREQARNETIREDILQPPPPMPGPGPTPSPGPTPGPVNDTNILFELTWTGSPFMDLDLEVARGDNEQVLGGPLITSTNPNPPPPVPSGGQHGGNTEAGSLGTGREIVTWPAGFPPDYYLVRVVLQNSGSINANVKVFRDTGGANQVVNQFDSIPIGVAQPVFQVHVAQPPGLPGPPPPLPPRPMPRQLPSPMPGPDSPEFPSRLGRLAPRPPAPAR